MSALPPKPYHYMTTAKPGDHEGFGHVYLCDVTGKKIASLWGKPDAKKALLQLILDAANGESADATKTAAAKSPAPERPMRERLNTMADESFPGICESDRNMFIDGLLSELRTPSAAVVDALVNSPSHMDGRVSPKEHQTALWQAAIDAISEGK